MRKHDKSITGVIPIKKIFTFIADYDVVQMLVIIKNETVKIGSAFENAENITGNRFFYIDNQTFSNFNEFCSKLESLIAPRFNLDIISVDGMSCENVNWNHFSKKVGHKAVYGKECVDRYAKLYAAKNTQLCLILSIFPILLTFVVYWSLKKKICIDLRVVEYSLFFLIPSFVVAIIAIVGFFKFRKDCYQKQEKYNKLLNDNGLIEFESIFLSDEWLIYPGRFVIYKPTITADLLEKYVKQVGNRLSLTLDGRIYNINFANKGEVETFKKWARN